MNTKHLLLSLLALLGSTTLHAYDAYIGGIYYNLNASTGKATVTYNSSNKYTGDVTIPATVTSSGTTYNVTSVGEYAFSSCTGLTSVIIPNSVTSIGLSAFQGSTGLTSVTIPNGVTTILSYAFKDCSALSSITIPESLTDIRSGAFYNCSGLTSIVVENGNTVFDSRNNCNAIIWSHNNALYVGCKNTTIPETVTSIGSSAFTNCTGLTSITIPNNVTSIDAFAFRGCTGLTSIIIPPSVTIIDEDVFYQCSNLTSVTIPNSVTSIGGLAFADCSSLTSITIPNSVTSIGNQAFLRCSSLTSVVSQIETPFQFGNNAFYGISSECELIVPIGKRAAYINKGWTTSIFQGGVYDGAEVNIGSTGYATYCSTHALDFSGVTGLKAYIASGFSPSTGKLVLTRVDEVPAGEGLYLVGEEGTYTVPFTTTDMLYSNFLKGVTTATTIYPTEGIYTNFILSTGSYGVGFYTLSSSGELAAGKAYLQLPTASVSNVKAISLAFDDDDPTALQEIEDYTTAKDIYNLQGQKVSAPRSGLYIINGKKVAIK